MWTMLVEAIISSAGSLLMSRIRMCRQISRLIGQIWILESVRENSGESKYSSIRLI